MNLDEQRQKWREEDDAATAIEQGRIAAERDRMDHAENMSEPPNRSREERQREFVSSEIASAVSTLDYWLGQMNNVPRSTQIALAMYTHSITAIVEELER